MCIGKEVYGYRKVTNTDIYVNWKSFTPTNWKWGTLEALVWRAYDVCSSDYYLGCELQHLKKVFHKQNNYLIWVINKMFKEFQSKQNETAPIATGNEEWNNNVKHHLLVLPYKGSDAMHIISSLRKQVNCALPDDVKMIVFYTGKKLGTCFNMKDKTVFNHENDIVYYAKCPEEYCPHDYVSESGRRVLERMKDHNGRGTSSHVFKHCVAADHQFVSCDDLRIVGGNYLNKKQKQKIVEALLIKI